MYVCTLGRERGFVRGRYKQLRYVNAGDGDEDKENFIIKTMRFGVKQDETDFERSAKRRTNAYDEWNGTYGTNAQ